MQAYAGKFCKYWLIGMLKFLIYEVHWVYAISSHQLPSSVHITDFVFVLTGTFSTLLNTYYEQLKTSGGAALFCLSQCGCVHWSWMLHKTPSECYK